MSNTIRYDSLLVRYLAAELDRRLAGRALEALRLDPDRRRAALVLDRGEALVWNLHPTAGRALLGPAPALPEEVALPRRATVERVMAPADERSLVFELSSAGRQSGRPRRLVVELLGNQWNLAAVDPEDRIVAVLWRRSAGERLLRPGARYAPPPPSKRIGVEQPLDAAAWRALLESIPPAERARRLVAGVAYTSPLNAGAILGEAARSETGEALEAAYRRYLGLATLPPAEPCILETDGRRQPYPLPLPGVPAVPFPTLLEALAAAAGEEAPEAAPLVSLQLLERLRERVARLAARRERLGAELAGAGTEAPMLRREADLLLSQLHLARKGMERVELADFEGGTVTLALDPALSPVENANRLYDRAKKRERAAGRLPALLRRTEAERDRLAALLARADAGEAGPREVEEAVGTTRGVARRGGEEMVLPYRTYRTTGGLELRVGRSSRANDDLTFHHSSPNDVWLHARDAAGAHVILRWGDATANPPARDLAEAAVLAALHSRARTSGTVAVDWTRRKYVRKPRKAPPGLVAIERAKTVFVEPDEAVERRLRTGEA